MEDKIYFKPGDVVTLRLDIPNKPIMVVDRIESSVFKNEDGSKNLKGIRCRWFTVDLSMEEQVFNTKDLIYYDI